jgi:integrase/recombinase XerC
MALKLPKYIDGKDADKFFSGINCSCRTGLRNMTALQLMYRAGLRVSEVCNLSPDDIKWDNGLIYIQQAKGKKDRYAVLDGIAKEWCEKWDKVRPKSSYFLSTIQGGRLSDRYLRTVCYRLSDKSQVYLNDNHSRKKVHPHTLRHSFATKYLNDDICNLRELQELMGHESIMSTQVYTHVSIDKLAEKIQRRINSGVKAGV